jgi:hypothetical protein
MVRLILPLIVFLFMPAQAQNLRPPRDLDKLAMRAAEFWRLTGMGQRARAVEYVLPSKREQFINRNSIPLNDARIAGISFTEDAERAIVAVEGKSILSVGIGLNEARIEEVWVWERNNWYADPYDPVNPFSVLNAGPGREANLSELEQSFRLPATVINVGAVWYRDKPAFQVPIEYTGAFPLRLTGPEDDALVIVDKDTGELVSPGAKSFSIRILPGSHEGPFRLPVPITVHYRDVSVEKTLIVEGAIFVPLTFRQAPDPIPPIVPENGFELFVKNNTENPVVVQRVETDGLNVEGIQEIPAGGEIRLVLTLRKGIRRFLPQIVVTTAEPIRGRNRFPFTLRKSTP